MSCTSNWTPGLVVPTPTLPVTVILWSALLPTVVVPYRKDGPSTVNVLEPETCKEPVTSIVPLTFVSIAPAGEPEPVRVIPVPSEPVKAKEPETSRGDPPIKYPSTFKFPATCSVSSGVAVPTPTFPV